MTTTTELWDEIAQALTPLAVEVPGLQVLGRGMLNPNPTPPSLDVYPGDPFMTGAGMGVGSAQCFFTIRARVGSADSEAGQRLLVRLLDPLDPASVEAAIDDVAVVVPDGVSGFREYDAGEGNRLLGAEWRVSAFLDAAPSTPTPPDDGEDFMVTITNLSSAQLLALHTTPVEIIPDPGVGMMVARVFLTFLYAAGTTPYNISGAESFKFGPAGWGGPSVLDQAADTSVVQDVTATNAGVFLPASVWEHKPWLLTCDANPTGGNGTLRVHAEYTVAPTP